ncbi:MAG: response regulator [Eubacterium sp.]|nr:response regulator [Eubacterium sp.]
MEIAQYILENNGLLVDLAVNGEEAVEMFKNSEQDYYDVIFMDIMMPGLNGWDATRQIRTMKRSDAERVPIIAMSAPIWMKQ